MQRGSKQTWKQCQDLVKGQPWLTLAQIAADRCICSPVRGLMFQCCWMPWGHQASFTGIFHYQSVVKSKAHMLPGKKRLWLSLTILLPIGEDLFLRDIRGRCLWVTECGRAGEQISFPVIRIAPPTLVALLKIALAKMNFFIWILVFVFFHSLFLAQPMHCSCIALWVNLQSDQQ